ncbi:MAG: VCBS repeat-containing protein [Verrucomicrobia bacterium]|nr:VCBS repeat-containing protein [Verrucomicrobiota bacterium]
MSGNFFHSALVALVCFASLLLTACEKDDSHTSSVAAAPPANLSTVRTVVASEELILQLSPRLKALSESFLTSRQVGDSTGGLFADSISVVGVLDAPSKAGTAPISGSHLVAFSMPLSDQQVESQRGNLQLWQGGVPTDSDVKWAKFYLISGAFTEGTDRSFVTPCGFEALVRSGEKWIAVSAHQDLTWTQQEDDEWKISGWRQKDFEGLETPSLLFDEVLATAVPDEATRRRAIVSRHQEILVESYFGGKPARTPRSYTDKRFFPDSVNDHPALSVVDIDNDGWDDLYVCVRWGKNMLFRNLGNGTFEEVASNYGLDVEGRSTSATFADFDNDGDPDLMLGRSLERSQYLINAGGNFIEASFGNVEGELPYLVTSTSSADYNGDGLLDIFFCTYSPLDITARITGKSSAQPEWVDKFFLSAEEAAEVKRRYAKYHGFLGQVGPPNVLFVNKGDGKFARAPESAALAGYRNTFQATWSDFDKDGDPDLYVANDFALDHFFRNDGGAGFTDITEASGTKLMGFGMGAAFGDYDNDGWQDLYVSNMYSKAGRRITAQVPGIDQRMVAGAEGNYLFRNNGDATFQRTSGLEKPAIQVANAGWSWGGQFADFDNDGFLDLYVSSGFYTPPDGIGNNVDL